MNMIAVYLSLSVLILGLVIQFFCKKSSSRSEFFGKILFFGSTFFIFLYYLFLTVNQYFAWKNGGSSFIYFLPPHKSIFYLLNHHFIRFGLYYLISFGVALLFLYIAKKYNRKMSHRFFENEELYFGALSILLLGNINWSWGWCWYLLIIFIFSLFISLIREKFLGIKERLPLYNLWLPIAILVILINVI